jgi:hypothetical protein
MRNIKLFVRKAYWTALNNTIIYKGLPVPCYDTFAPDNAQFPYILIGNQTQEDDKDNQQYNYITTITLDVVTGGLAPYGRMDADTIADSVLQIVCRYPENYLQLQTGKIVTEKLIQQTSLSSITDTNIIHREILTIQNWIDGQG